MTYDKVHTGELDIGGVIQRMFQVVLRNPIVFFGLSLVFVGLPSAWFQYAMGPFTFRATRTINWEIVGAAYAALALGSGLFHIAVVRPVIEDAERRPSLIDCFATLFRFLLPGLALGLLFLLGYMLGAVLLVVPAIIFLCAFYVAMPAMVAERKGVFASFSRSAQLTSGYRGAIFGMLFLVGLMFGIAALVVSGIGLAFGRGAHANLVTAIIHAVTTTIASGFQGALSSVVYLRLVKLRGGIEQDKVAQVFS